MRQRYYNPEIKRFVNQDILTGSIGNSQSLNRYSYVQGNPVSYTDPFGLSPLNGLFSGTMLVHTVLGLIGWIPGPVGAIANAVDGLVYLFVDKDVKNAILSAGSALSFGAGKIVAKVGKGSASALRVQRVCNAIGNGINFAQSAEGTYQTASMMVDKYIVQGQPFSGSTVLEFALLGANMFGAYKSGTYVGNDIADFGGYLKRSWNAKGARDGSASRGLLSEYLGKTVNNENGKFYSIMNEAGGQVFVSTENIVQSDIAKIVSATEGKINIISGRHGDWMDNIRLEPDFYAKDVARFGNMKNVNVFNFSNTNLRQIQDLINSKDTTILGWCYSEYSSFMRELFK